MRSTCPSLEGYDLRTLPLVERKALLARVVPPAGPLRYLDHIETQGEAFFAQVERMGLEGIIAKKADSPYKGGRSPVWLKIKAARSDDFVVVGFTAPKGSRAGFGALHLAQYVGKQLVYAGRAGSGFDDQQLGDVRKELEGMAPEDAAMPAPARSARRAGAAAKKGARAKKPTAGDYGMTIADFESTTWVEPKLVAEVRFTEWTNEGVLRHPVFLRFRDDKKPEECVRQEAAEGGEGGNGARKARTARRAEDARQGEEDVQREVPFSNLKKIYWPKDKYTKGDLIDYYRMVAPALLPYLRDRPLVLTRYPDGIEGKSFFQKDAPDFVPGVGAHGAAVERGPAREIDYIVCEDVESLLYVVNLGSIPLHMWGSRVAALERPDWCILDLDPKEAPFTDVVKVAHAIHARCDAHRPAALHQDHGVERPARDDPAGAATHLRPVPVVRRAAGAADRGGAARDRDDHAAGGAAGGEGVRGLPAERAGQDDRGALQRASAAGRAGVGAPRVERGDAEAGPAGVHHREHGGPAQEAEDGPDAAGADRGAGHRVGD